MSSVLNSNRMLDQLHQVPLAEPVSWLPQTKGWLILLLVLVVALLIAGWCYWQHWRRNAYRRAALRELSLLESGRVPLSTLPALLKRAAMAGYGREAVAGLSGNAWLAFLDGAVGETLFCSPLGNALVRLAYVDEEPDADQRRALLAQTRRWIVRHGAAA